MRPEGKIRSEKKSIVGEIREQLEKSEYALVSDYRGLTVAALTELRDAMRDLGCEVHIVKNAFLGLAAEDLKWEPGAPFMEGPTAMVTGDGEVTEVAKVLKTFAKERGLPVAKGGWLATRLISADDVDMMAKLPSQEVMRGMLVGTLAAPMCQLAGVMQQKLLTIVYVLKAIEEKKS